ncbi:MAG: SDR family NAD(P)-dependent oxidoreductase [Pseudomonadota bacterium]
MEKWIAGGKLGRLVELWTKGLEVDWRLLYGSGRPRRMALPTYPFAKERYWVDLSALRGEGPGDVRTATLLHPLLHENTSDLDAQRYTSVFDGEEFFLADHRIRGADGASLRVLPGVAYLEMARAAVAQALPQRPHDAALELRNTVWAQPAIVDGATRVHIALSPNDDGGIDYDIHGDVAEEHADREAAPIHCQGTVRFDDALSERLDPVALRARMGRDRIDAEALYATCARMGLLYGPRFRGVVALHRGEGEVLAELRLPAGAAREGFVLHPSLMDSALQAAVGLIEGGAEQSRLPFALERLRVVAPCVPEMQAWIRYAEGSGPRDAVVKLDIDLCDAHGNVCVQMHGFSWRFASLSAMSIPMQSQDARQAPAGLLLAVPAWEPVAPAAPAQAEPAHAHRPTLLCELPKVDPRRLSVALGGDECVALSAMPNAPVAERYRHHAVACFERIKALLERRLEGRTLLRVVVPDEGEQAVFAGLSGLLKTASLENPLLTTQLVRVPAQIASKALAERLQQATLLAHEPVLRFRGERCEAPRWREAPADVEPMPDYAANGVYLITGGLGALGLLFARDILDRAPGAHVVLGGRSVLTEERRPLLEALAGDRGRASYRQIDLEDAADVARAVSAIVAERGRLDGVLHSAGMIADNFILKKSVEEFGRVLAPKVLGTAHLDAATRDLDLELFALFSSMAGPLGNPGQADYAAANAFLDAFAEHRAAEVAAGRRRGRTLSIDWPLWESGGMAIERVAQEVLESSTGLRPMRTATGLRAFRRMLALDAAGAMAIEGDVPRMRRRLLGAPAPAVDAAPAREDAAPDGSMQGRLLERTRDYLREEFSGILKLAAHRIDPDAALEQYGIDSVLAMRLTNQLERTFGSLSKTLFFEYQTIAALAGYLVKAHSDALTRRLGVDGESAPPPSERAFLPEPVRAVRASARGRFAAARPAPVREVAIVGLAGRYPQAENVDEFWRNLKLGRDCIGEVPPERWDHARYFDPDPNKPGKTYSKWGGFLDDIDRFDPLFFNISPKEAELTDPQERLFLETVWQAIEDAGYSRDGIASRRVGVYVGVMWGQYELYGAESVLRGNTAVPTSSHASVANRISYYFDFRGPSLAIDTMCSSSLTAIHLACEELRRGEIEAAIAGGVNLTSHPYKYLTLSQGKFMATDGRCRSFGRGGDGYVPGEGVGAIVLKPLDRALRDGDQVYAVIRATAVNHGGKTNGYSVPNPNAQAELIADACRRGGVDPKTLGYIETHGTGTALGDPIEITGLTKAFEGATDEKQFCPIGSVKSNIGHLEAAAGIAAVTKALLQLKHRQLAPSLHADPLNPNISFENTPFRVQTELADWKRIAGQPRRVGVSSFGAGGANAHVILEEFGVEDPVVYDPAVVGSQEAFLLSARDHEALRRYATRMIARLREAAPPALEEIAFTSQVGRTPMPVRLVVVADSVATLADRLSQWLALQPSGDGRSGAGAHELADVYHGSIREFHYGAGDLIDGRAGDAFLDDLLSARDLPKLARLWIMGVDIDWSRLRRGARPKRVSLPTYPFARERYWIEAETPLSSPRPIELRKAEGRRGDARKSARAASATVAESRQRMYCRPYWAPTPLETPPPSESTGPILVLDTSDALFLALRARLGETAAARMALVVPGDGFARTADGTYTVDPTREQDFHALVERLAADRLLPALVVHRGCDAADDGRDAVERGLATGVYALFHLCKALMTQKQATSLKLLSAFAAGGAATPPLAPAIAGFLKTLTLENPGYRAKAVEIDGVGGEPSDEEMAAAILRELQEPAWTANEVRYVRDSGSEPMRLTGELVPFVPASPGGTLPMRDGATYVITGGLGGLGLIFAEYLARKHRAKLVLTGRSSRGQKQAEAIARLESHGAEVLFVQGDVSLAEDAARIVREAKVRFGAIHGVIHSAGANRDAFLLKKDVADFAAVLAPKVHGALALDLATREEPLELFALFASVAGAIGNPGQCDYAYGNHFLDAFAQRRETLRRSGLRAGRTVAIDWPLWEEGGMGLSPEEIRRQEAQVGASPLPTAEGLRCWEDALRADAAQIVVLYGLPSRMSGSIARKSAKGGAGAATRVADVDPAILFGKIEDYLKAMVGREIKLAPERIAASERFESFGVDSVMIGKFNAELERDLGVLPKTLFYEYETIEELAKYLQQYARDALVALFGLSGGTLEAPAEPLPHEVGFDVDDHDPHADEAFDEPERFAIIGIHGRYPHAANLDEFWENLRLGRDATGAVPTVRWNSEALYDPDPAASADGRIYCRSGGFLDDVDRFDAAFFNIPADEAKIADPQERLFLESVWAAVEDAGYTREGMRRMFPKGKGADVGVFVGVTTNSYHLLAAQAHAQGAAVHASAMPWSIANRVSYVFDFNGPSMPIDTACSSSLVAVHLACESLRHGECRLAIAGGVNLYLHPAKYQSLCHRRMLALEGKCRSYGAGDDGFVPGEGVGSVLLKPLSRAIADRDRIYAVVSGSAYDHSGRSNGYSAPNPNAQAHLIATALAKARIHPESISCIEGHGTGTQLGDSLEVAAMTQAFRRQTDKKQYCPMGSVKANIGHSESAAGMAGLAKVLLQIRHRQLAPTIHCDPVNPDIDFADSPFHLQRTLTDWNRLPMYPRRALINSFGAGGVNACVIVEEYEKPQFAEDSRLPGPYLFVLSARNEARLRDYVERLLVRLRSDRADRTIDPADLCYTLQVGREAMEERLSAVVNDIPDLVGRLEAWIRRGDAAGLHRGSAGPRRGGKRPLTLAMGERDLAELALMWAAGEDVDWDSLYPGETPHRIGLPTYPFARDRHWVAEPSAPSTPAPSEAVAQLHPLIGYNASTLRETAFASTLPDSAFYAREHMVAGERIFPGAGFLEMACVAGTIAGERRVRSLRDIVWAQPLGFRRGAQHVRTSLKPIGDAVEFAIVSFDDEHETIVHAEGRLAFREGWTGPAFAAERVSLQALRERATRREDGAAWYERFREHDFEYGPAFRSVRELFVGDGFALSRLRIDERLKSDYGRFVLHPSMIDGALQTVAGLVAGDAGDAMSPHVPFALDEVEIAHPIPQQCYALATFAEGGDAGRAGIRRFDILLLNEDGDVLVAMRNLYVRALVAPAAGRRSPAVA